MTKAAEKLKSTLLGLSERDREELAFFLLNSIGESPGPDESPEWEAELERRSREFSENPSIGIPTQEMFRRARKKLS